MWRPAAAQSNQVGFSLLAREPSEIGDNSTCKLYHGDLYDSTPIYSLHQFILSRFLEQQLSFQGLNKKKIEKQRHADIITINREFCCVVLNLHI